MLSLFAICGIFLALDCIFLGGKEVRITEYDANGNVTGWTVKTYFEDDGRIHTVFVYDADGTVISGTEYA